MTNSNADVLAEVVRRHRRMVIQDVENQAVVRACEALRDEDKQRGLAVATAIVVEAGTYASRLRHGYEL